MDRIENAKMLLQRVGKINLGFYPTPLQRLDRISNEYEINLYAKREDFSGMTLFGGNKIRKLEYLLNDAKKQLGRKFVLKDFHKFFLSLGPVPFTVAKDRMQGWIEMQLRQK